MFELVSVSAPLVFLQGLVSFLSPCVLPLVPAYLAFLGGAPPAELMDDAKAKRGLVLNTLAFILGFTIVFALIGATATALGAILNKNAKLLSIFSGFLVVIFGLVTMDILRVPFLERERRFDMANVKQAGALRSVLIGAAFGFGWTPCIGPVLASVLVMASRLNTLAEGVGLLLLYALGLGLPFLLFALFIRALWKPLERLKRFAPLIRKISGAVLVVIGVLMMTNTFSLLAALGAPSVAAPSPATAPALSIDRPSPTPAPSPDPAASAALPSPTLMPNQNAAAIDPRSKLTREQAGQLADMLEDVELPPIMLDSLGGGTLSTDDFEGVRVINLLATWCPYCIEELPILQKVTSEYGVALIGIDTFENIPEASVKEKLNALLAELPAPFPVMLDKDNEWGSALSPRGSVPITLILDANNRVRFYRPGAFQSEQELGQLLDFMLYHLQNYVG